MPDSTISDLDQIAVWAANDLLVIIDVGSTNTSKKTTLKEFFANIPSNTSIKGLLSVFGSNTVLKGSEVLFQANVVINAAATFKHSLTINNSEIRIANSQTPANGNTSLGGVGTICWDESFLYIQTRPLTLKRVALSTF